jgi:uncharacterized membrane protein
MRLFTPGLLWFSAIGCGLLAGVYFAFSTFVMTSLDRVGPASGIAAMNAINGAIVRSLFMPLFVGTTLSCLLLIAIALLRRGEAGAGMMLCGGILYLVGMTGVTMVWNVPLNDSLAGADPSARQAAALWSRYLTDWTFWNHVRTIASTGAFALFIGAIAAR